MQKEFPWEQLFKIAFQVLGLKPWEFWRLTPRELLLMLPQDDNYSLILKQELDDLIKKFPD